MLGESGVGKSETAVELIVRGHRLIADDAVEIRRISDHSLVGSAPENIRHFMELRGIGVINARRMFGMASVKLTEKIALILRLEPWEDSKMYKRLGEGNEYMEILGVKVPPLTIPVKAMGYDPEHELLKRLGMPDDTTPNQARVIENNYWDIQ
jgi:HPr kinase/phosphorylase